MKKIKNGFKKISLGNPSIEDFSFKSLNNAKLESAIAEVLIEASKKKNLAAILYVKNKSTDSLHGLLYQEPETGKWNYYFSGNFEIK